jgi:phosphate starvation-inducible protein PhoH
MGRNRFKEEKEYNDLIRINTKEDIERIKSEINKILPRDLKIKAMNDSQIKLIKSIKTNEITICAGPAGTGKTFVAMGIALNLLKKSTNRFKKIYLVKSVKTLKDEEVGFLPGDIREKIEPAMWSFYLNMEKVMTDIALKQLVEKDIVRPAPLAFIRGASLDDCIIIADECVSGENKIIIKTSMLDKKPKHIKLKRLPHYFKKYNNLTVLSHNDKTNKNEYKEINSIRITKNKETIKIKLRENINDLIITKNHPFAVIDSENNIKYVTANELSVGDKILKRKNKSGNHSILNEKNYDILLGFLLGDGCLQKNKQWGDNVFRIRKQHSLKQMEYNKFCGLLYNTECSSTGKSGFTGENMSVLNTKSFYINSDFIERLFPNGKKKRITAGIEKYMTVRTLATWFMDDGSNHIYNNKGSNISLHSEGFTKTENHHLLTILKNKFNIELKIETIKKPRKDRVGDFNSYFYLRLNNENSNKFQNLIKEYVHPSMYYKLNDDYKGYFKFNNYFNYLNNYELTTSTISEINDGGVTTVYNMEVNENNNYFVNNILTHNCQNISLDNSRTLLTRIGSNAKIILLGDINQIDMRNKTDSSLETLLDMFNEVENMGVIKMSDEDTNIRNPLITIIEKKYKEHIETNNNGNGRKKQQLNG